MGRYDKLGEALSILKDYDGGNPYILMLQKQTYVDGNAEAVGDFQVGYILRNHSREPETINRIVKIADWYGERKKEDWRTEFTPSKLKIVSYLGETDTTYHCYVQYRKSVDPVGCFIPKKALLTNFFVSDYHKVYVDFGRYNRLSQSKDPKRVVKPHQMEAVQFLLDRRKCILADDQGLGKTLSLSVAAIEGNFDSIVIICPASLKTNWKRELMWYVNERDITVVESFTGMKKAELEKFLGYMEGGSKLTRDELMEIARDFGKWKDNRFMIVNYDILSEFYEIPASRGKDAVDRAYVNSPMLQYIKDRKSCIIVDEAHRLSDSKSIRYKVIYDLIRRGSPDSIYLATGTPVTNNPQNLFCMLRLLGDPITDDWNYYMERYCGAKRIPAKGEWKRCCDLYLSRLGKSSWGELTAKEKDSAREFMDRNMRKITVSEGVANLDELKDRISHLYLRRVKEDLNGMVQKTVHEIYYTLSDRQKAEYDRLWDEYEKAQTEEDPSKELNKDLLEGAIYRRYISNEMVPRTEALADRIIGGGEKIVIACCYDEELYTLRDYYGERCVVFNGKMNSRQKDEAVGLFMDDPSKMVFIGNVNAAGVGITLTSAHHLVFNNMSFVPGDNLQMQDRICRIGQDHDCHIYYQIFRDTQYEHMWDIVMRKSIVINSIIKKEEEK